MASTGFTVDMDYFGNGGRQLRPNAPILCSSAPFSSRSSSISTAQTPRSRQGETLVNLL